MKYFIDTEFIEGFHKPVFGKNRHFIDLISIGVYREDGQKYHCLSSEYAFKDASNWVRNNVIIPMYRQGVNGDARNRFSARNFHKYYGKTNQVLAWLIILLYSSKFHLASASALCSFFGSGWCSLFHSFVDVFGYYDSIIYNKSCCKYDSKEGQYIDSKSCDVHDKECTDK